LTACPGEPPGRRKRLGDISYTRRVIDDFVLYFGCHGNYVVVWRHSIDHPWIPPTRRRRHRDIFYTSGFIPCLVSNFVAMATRVGRCKIWLKSPC